MAWARMVFYPGGTEDQYRAVTGEVGEAFEHAEGRTYFAAGPTEGGWIMFMVWESQEQFQRFAAEHIGPAHQRAGERGWQVQPQVTDFDPQQVFVS